MKRPAVTVLMALYNGGEYLKQSVQSILSQTYGDFEFLIINDCSMDNSLEVIESFRDERIKIHNNIRNLGQTKSLNLGLELAMGDYIARMDGDDIALPQWLETQVNYMKEHPEYSVVSSYAIAIDEQNKIKKIYKPPHSQEDIILRSLVASPINHVGSIFKKKDISGQGGYDETYKTAADYDLWGKLLRNNLKITANDEVLVAIREHAQSLSRSERGRRGIAEIIDIARKNIEAFTNVQLSNEEVALFCRANYEAGNLTESEFMKALNITGRVYNNLRPFLAIEKRKITQWLDNRYQTIYLKRIFAVILEQNSGQARRLSWQGIRTLGFRAIFFIFVVGSLFGKTFLYHLLGLCEKILRKMACLQVNRKLRMVGLQDA